MGRSSRMMTFREVIETKMLANGMNKLQAFIVIYTQVGVSLHSSRAAFDGTRVLPATAEALWEWALRCHACEIDRLALVNAPAAKPRRKKAA